MLKTSIYTQLFIATLLFCSSFAYSQSFSFERDTIKGQLPSTGYVSFNIDIYNNTTDSIYLEWNRISNTFPNGWDLSVCDYTSCYIGLPKTGSFSPIPPSIDGFMKLNISAESIGGEGIALIEIVDTISKLRDTMSFVLNNPNFTSIASNVLRTNDVSLFPNPASDMLKIKVSHPSNILVYDISGVIVKSFYVLDNDEVNVADFKAGKYLIHVNNELGSVVKSIVVRK